MRRCHTLTFIVALFINHVTRCLSATVDGYATKEAYVALPDTTVIDMYQGKSQPVVEAGTRLPTIEAECLDYIKKVVKPPKGTIPHYTAYSQLNNPETQSLRGPGDPVYILVLDVFCYHLTATGAVITDYTGPFIADVLKATKQDALSQLPAKKKAFEAYVKKTGGARTGNESVSNGSAPKGITLQLAYIAANVDEAKLIDAGKYSTTAFCRDKIQNFFTPQCQVELDAYNGPSADSAFGYAGTFIADDETAKLGVKYVYALKVACCVVTKAVDETHTDIGKLLQDDTTDVIKAVGWRKEDALAQAKKTQGQMGNSGGDGGSSGGGGGGNGSSGGGNSSSGGGNSSSGGGNSSSGNDGKGGKSGKGGKDKGKDKDKSKNGPSH